MSESEPYIPKNPVVQGIRSLFNNGEHSDSADITFDINNGEERLYAHHLILQGCAPALAEYCDSCKDNDDAVSIKDVKPGIFRHLLCYVYGGTISDDILKENAKDLIDIADRFGVGHLKVVAEVSYVKSTAITVDNFTENFYLTDTKKCALLKEKVMDFLMEKDADELLKKLSSQDEVPQSQSLLPDILTALTRKRKRDDNESDDPENLINTMSVDELREELDQRGLNVDGTREMLIDLIRKHIWVDKIVVEGAGVLGANGTYMIDGSRNGAFKYKKSGQYAGETTEFTMYRYDDHPGWWQISINDRSEELDLYESDNCDEITPPTGLWKPSDYGDLPPPTISFGKRTT